MFVLLVQHVGQHLGVHLALALRLYAGTDVGAIDALAHVHAASVASTDEIRAEVLLAVAYVESRFDPYWVSRIEGRRRIYGQYRGSTPPTRLDKTKTLLVLDRADENVVKSCRNLRHLRTTMAHQLNPYDLLHCDALLVTSASLDRMKEVFAG